MQKKHASIKYIYSRVTIYYNNKIELRWRRSIHHCTTCDLVKLKELGLKCGAIHYGICTGLAGAPTVAVPVPVLAVTNKRLPATVAAREADSNKQQPIKEKEAIKEREKESTLPERDKVTNKENKQHSVQVAAPSIQHVHINKETIKDGGKAKRNNNNSTVLSKPQVPNHVQIPTFYFPMGRPVPAEETDSVLQRVAQAFSKYDGGKVYHKDMNIITKVCGMPLYWKYPLFFAAGGEKQEFITFQMFATMWKKLIQTNHDTAARFICLLARPGANCLTSEELIPLIQDVVETHPGLSFLQEAPEFHSRYVHTVIARIFYCVNRSWTGKITVPELRKSNFLQTLALLEDEEDINQITDFFSYEHFYVIYCKFWELDKDHDLYIDKEDLVRHNDHAISSRMIDRIFSGAVTRGQTQKEGKLSYPDFVFFLISEEDKRHPTSVEYWFRCMDLDGDGVISMYEMEYFYEEQMQKMESLGIEKLPFQDCLCQMFDLVRPRVEGKITLKDLKACKLTNIFFDTFFNLDKFLDHEQRDPFANARDLENSGPELSDWEKFASEEYEILVAEEGINEQEEIHYEDDFEVDDDDLLQDEMIIHPDPPSSPKKSIPRTTTSSDIYDFGNSTNLGY